MPELPEVETVRRTLRTVLLGRRIDRVHVYDRRLRYPVQVQTLRRRVQGQRIRDIHRRAKYLLLELEDGHHVLVHLGMSGRLVVTPKDAPRLPHVHVVFSLENDHELRFRDPRRFGLVAALTPRGVKTDRRLTKLGVEPLSDGFSADEFYRRTRRLQKPVKNYLMDMKELVGVGNIYANEALFQAGIRPTCPVGRIGLSRWGRLVECVKGVLVEAIEQGGTTINDFQDGTGDEGFFQQRLQVYDRAGEACSRCEGMIRRVILAGRSTFYCPRCQR